MTERALLTMRAGGRYQDPCTHNIAFDGLCESNGGDDECGTTDFPSYCWAGFDVYQRVFCLGPPGAPPPPPSPPSPPPPPSPPSPPPRPPAPPSGVAAGDGANLTVAISISVVATALIMVAMFLGFKKWCAAAVARSHALSTRHTRAGSRRQLLFSRVLSEIPTSHDVCACA